MIQLIFKYKIFKPSLNVFNIVYTTCFLFQDTGARGRYLSASCIILSDNENAHSWFFIYFYCFKSSVGRDGIYCLNLLWKIVKTRFKIRTEHDIVSCHFMYYINPLYLCDTLLFFFLHWNVYFFVCTDNINIKLNIVFLRCLTIPLGGVMWCMVLNQSYIIFILIITSK